MKIKIYLILKYLYFFNVFEGRVWADDKYFFQDFLSNMLD